jgi:hypothetical protein
VQSIEARLVIALSVESLLVLHRFFHGPVENRLGSTGVSFNRWWPELSSVLAPENAKAAATDGRAMSLRKMIASVSYRSSQDSAAFLSG